MKKILLATMLLGACAPNFLDGNDYTYFGGWRCHEDGSLILAQKANSVGNFTDPKLHELASNCTKIEAPEWDILKQVIAHREERKFMKGIEAR